MNAFWGEISAMDGNVPQQIYDWVKLFEDIDNDKAKDGHKLESDGANLVFQRIGETMTHIALKKKLEAVDLDADNHMSLIEFLLAKKDVFSLGCYNYKEMHKRPQGTNEELAKARAEVQKLLKMGEDAIAKEEALIAKIAQLEGKVVKLNRAKNELEQHRNRDPLPFNTALITAQAAVRTARSAEASTAGGFDWWVQHELEIAASYKPNSNWKKKGTN